MLGLSRYNAVIFFSTSRDNLDDNAKTALRQYMRAGGGFVGIHNAFGTMYNWPYYEGLLGGANYYDHGPERGSQVVIQDPNDASTKALPARWAFTDEWYNLIPFPTHVRFLATVDEKSYGAPRRPAGGPRRLSTDIVPQGSRASRNRPWWDMIRGMAIFTRSPGANIMMAEKRGLPRWAMTPAISPQAIRNFPVRRSSRS